MNYLVKVGCLTILKTTFTFTVLHSVFCTQLSQLKWVHYLSVSGSWGTSGGQGARQMLPDEPNIELAWNTWGKPCVAMTDSTINTMNAKQQNGAMVVVQSIWPKYLKGNNFQSCGGRCWRAGIAWPLLNRFAEIYWKVRMKLGKYYLFKMFGLVINPVSLRFMQSVIIWENCWRIYQEASIYNTH